MYIASNQDFYVVDLKILRSMLLNKDVLTHCVSRTIKSEMVDMNIFVVYQITVLFVPVSRTGTASMVRIKTA